jgi:predicted nucleotide-binding protein
MSPQRQAPPPPQIPAPVDPSQGIRLLTRQIEAGRKLLEHRFLTSDDHSAWETLTNNFLIKAFGSESPNVSRVMQVGKGPRPVWGGQTEAEHEEDRKVNLKTQIRLLESLTESLQADVELRAPTQASNAVTLGNDVFLVHGHDELARLATARFLEQLGVNVITLAEQPNHGRTIIEKFEDCSNVAFAVVLLTPDDQGGSASVSPEHLSPRARQNVILELGFFLGKLNRRHVCALYREGVEIPSDYHGVLFVPMDNEGAWKLKLARELKMVGLSIDLNKAL